MIATKKFVEKMHLHYGVSHCALARRVDEQSALSDVVDQRLCELERKVKTLHDAHNANMFVDAQQCLEATRLRLLDEASKKPSASRGVAAVIDAYRQAFGPDLDRLLAAHKRGVATSFPPGARVAYRPWTGKGTRKKESWRGTVIPRPEGWKKTGLSGDDFIYVLRDGFNYLDLVGDFIRGCYPMNLEVCA
jgi:hypothetical protein